MKTKIIKDWYHPHDQNNHVLKNVFVSKDLNPTKSLFRYMSVEKCYHLLKTGEFIFSSPLNWFDPFEKRFLLADYSNVDFKLPNVYCSCFTQKASNEASWQMYSYFNRGIGMRTIKVEFNYEIFYGFLALAAGATNMNIYISNVTYKPSQTISCIHEQKHPYHNEIFSSFDNDKFADLMLLKRKAFEYESELRIIYMSEYPMENNQKELKVVIPLKELSTIIKSILVSPDSTELEYMMIQHEFNTMHPLLKINRSTLYDSMEESDKIVIESL